jgi:hypothetical protein
VGPALKWNSGDTPFLSDSNALGWRTVVTTDLNTVLDIWLPVVLSCILLSTASANMRSQYSVTAYIAYSWPKMSTFLLFTGLFGAFGYCGNFGVCVGMFCSLSAIYCGVVHVLALHDGKFPCFDEESSKSGTPFFDRVMRRAKGGGGGGGAKAGGGATKTTTSSGSSSGKGPSTKSPVTGKDAYTTSLPFHARYR